MEPMHKNVTMQSTYEDYGQGWLVNDGKTLKELGDDELKLFSDERFHRSEASVGVGYVGKLLGVDFGVFGRRRDE